MAGQENDGLMSQPSAKGPPAPSDATAEPSAAFATVKPKVPITNMRDGDRPRSFTLVETFADITLNGERKVELVRWISGMGFELRFAKDDPVHPGGVFSFPLQPVLQAVLNALEAPTGADQ